MRVVIENKGLTKANNIGPRIAHLKARSTMAMHAAAVPTTANITLYALPGTMYVTKRPLMVVVEQDEGGSYVVSEPHTGVFHYDEDWSAAVTGFISAFVNEYETLSAKEASLSPSMCAELDNFRHLIELAPKK